MFGLWKKDAPKMAASSGPRKDLVDIAIINASTVCTDAEVELITQALQVQVTYDFAPIWGLGATLHFVPSGAKAPANMWWLTFLDNSDVAGALGYHDLTPAGQPIGKVFAGTDKQFGSSVSVTASHELLEMLADPWINLCAFEQSTDTAGRLWAWEVCDACESDSLAYKIASAGNTLVSDFVYPAYFSGIQVPGVRYDHMGAVKSPFQILPDGYMGFFDVTSGSGWQQALGEKAPATAARPPIGSRRERRMAGRTKWVRSTVA